MGPRTIKVPSDNRFLIICFYVIIRGLLLPIVSTRRDMALREAASLTMHDSVAVSNPTVAHNYYKATITISSQKDSKLIDQ